MTQSMKKTSRRTVFSARDLAALAELRITPGKSEYRELPDGFWTVTFRDRPDGSLNHLITLALGYPPADEVCGLAWGLAPEDDPTIIHRAGRTDRRGQSWISGLAPDRTYRVRYVPRVQSVEDVAVLERVDDQAAQGTLEAAANDAELTPSVRARAAEALDSLREEPVIISMVEHLLRRYRDGERDVRVESLRRVPWRKFGGLAVTQSLSTGTLAARSGMVRARGSVRTRGGVPALPPLPELRSIKVQGEEIHLVLPGEDVPYGVVRIFAQGESSERLLGVYLMAMPEDKTDRGTRYRAGSVRTREVLGDQTDPLGIDYFAVPATEKTLSWFSTGEIQSLLLRPAMARDAQLRADLERLLERLGKKEEGHVEQS